MKRIIILACFHFIFVSIYGQAIGINTSTPHSSSIMEIKSNNKGLLVPRTSTGGRLTIVSPAKGLIVYDTTLLSFFVYNGNAWLAMMQSNSAWSLTGNAGTTTSHFIGTTDKKNLRMKVNNTTVGILDTLEGNIGFGQNALGNATQFTNRNIGIGVASLNKMGTGDFNIAIGDSTISKSIFGSFGIAIGYAAMKNATQTNGNIAIGFNALLKVNSSNNIGIGSSALLDNTTGEMNIAIGENGLSKVSTGSNNISLGASAVSSTIVGKGNLGIGVSALGKSTTSEYQIAIGDSALAKQVTMSLISPNLAIGTKALFTSNNPGGFCTSVGHYSQEKLTVSSNNTTLGFGTMRNTITGSDNVAIGLNALNAGNNNNSNVAIGKNAMGSSTTANNNVAIGTSSMLDNDFDNSVAIGYESMKNNNAGGLTVAVGRATAAFAEYNSVAIGDSTMALSAGSLNVGIGLGVLKGAFGQNNIGIGTNVMYNTNNQGFVVNNVGMGFAALFNNNLGSNNTAIGYESMRSNLSGNYNFAVGYKSLRTLSAGLNNVALGYYSQFFNLTGDGNIAIGNSALFENQDKNANIAIGDSAMMAAIGDATNGLNSVAIGRNAMLNTTTGYNNTAVGYNVLINNITGKRIVAIGNSADVDIDSTNLNNAAVIGNNATVGESNTMAFGNNNMLNWSFGRKKVASAGIALQVGSNANNGNGAHLTEGGVWTNASDINKKEDLQDLDMVGIMDNIKKLNIQKWKYKGTNEYHIGPYAQQFYQLFAVGNDDTSVSTIDPSGIALAAIKELMIKIEEQQKEIDALKAKIK